MVNLIQEYIVTEVSAGCRLVKRERYAAM